MATKKRATKTRARPRTFNTIAKAYEKERASSAFVQCFSLQTRVPSKWLLVDMETGETYRPNENKKGLMEWKRFGNGK